MRVPQVMFSPIQWFQKKNYTRKCARQCLLLFVSSHVLGWHHVLFVLIPTTLHCVHVGDVWLRFLALVRSQPYPYIYINIYIHIYIYTYITIYWYIFMYMYMYTWIYINKRIFIFICIIVWIYIHVWGGRTWFHLHQGVDEGQGRHFDMDLLPGWRIDVCMCVQAQQQLHLSLQGG